ncbi:MAG TPA: hypothetical protein VHP58_04800 [Alphaproteobacteria bacterium]|nr:hypothetical protein [Alphaproteobacteria bacterium]
MIRFAAGLALMVLTLIIGTWQWFDQASQYQAKKAGLEDAVAKREEGLDLNLRIKKVRAQSMASGDDQKFTIERLLDIGAPGMEWRFVGQPRITGGTRTLYRHTFRIVGPSTFAKSQELMRRLVTLPGFVPYRFCYACGLAPKGTPSDQRMVQIEGYLYVYDPSTLY